MSLTARQIIKREYGNSRNFITPQIIRYGKVDKNLAYELSRGEGIKGEDIYGVSVVELKQDGTTERRIDLSNMFYSLREAQDYIKTLKGRD